MKFRLSGLALAATAVVSGCGLTGPTPSDEPAEKGRISINGTSQNTKSVECTQTDWDLTIDAAAKTGHAEVFLHLGGAEPIVRTVNIANINDYHGVGGGDTGKAKASIDGTVYTITGTVVGFDRANPSRSRPMSFEIKAPC